MMTEELIYLDHASATPIDDVVLMAMSPYFQEKFFNPSSPYSRGVEVKRDYQSAKQRLAIGLGVRSDELIMTAGATESVNIAFGASRGQVIVPEIEHSSVLASAKRGGQAIYLSVDTKGRITPDIVQQALTSETTFISIGLVNGELGIVQPIAEIARVIENERLRRRKKHNSLPLIFHTDASQALTLIDVKPNRLGVDLLTLSAAKIYGPKQVGLLWVRPGVSVKPIIAGGGQEQGLRSGTENVAGVIGFATALELVAKRRASEIDRLRNIRDNMAENLSRVFPEMIISSDNKQGLVSFLNVSFPGIDAERLIFWLETKGVMVASGSACSANKGIRSHVLKAIGLSDDQIDGSLRISLGRLSTDENCQRATELIIEAVKTEKNRIGQ